MSCSLALSVAAAGFAPPASAAPWPRRLFLVYAPPRLNHSTSAARVRDVAEGPGGSVFIATGDGLDPGAEVGLLRADGRVRRLAHFAWNGPAGGYGGGTGIGIGDDRHGGVLVVEGWDNRVVRVTSSGRLTTLAGTGLGGFSGDGGPALAADISPGNGALDGVTETAGGSVIFTDTWNNRIRSIGRGGVIRTLAGAGPPVNPFGFRCAPVGDGGPAPAAGLCYPSDVLAAADGSIVVVDSLHNRIRRLGPAGTITTLAGNGAFEPRSSADEGRPATGVPIAMPTGVAQLPGGDIAFTWAGGIDRVAPDGTWHSVLELTPGLSGTAPPKSPLMDFAGREVCCNLPTGIAATHEGGILFAAGSVYYLAPPRTSRTLVGIRDARVGDRRVEVAVEATRPGRATLQVRSRRRVVAERTVGVRAGRRRLRVSGRFAARPYDVRVMLRGRAGATATDAVSLHLGGVLNLPYVRRLAEAYADEVPLDGCRRITRRRIECRYSGGRDAPYTVSFALERSGVISVDGRPRQA